MLNTAENVLKRHYIPLSEKKKNVCPHRVFFFFLLNLYSSGDLKCPYYAIFKVANIVL